MIEPNGKGGYNYIGLQKLIDNEMMHNIFKPVDEDVVYYLSMTLTDSSGLNIRNNYCHGISKHIIESPIVANRLFHILTILLMVKKNN